MVIWPDTQEHRFYHANRCSAATWKEVRVSMTHAESLSATESHVSKQRKNLTKGEQSTSHTRRRMGGLETTSHTHRKMGDLETTLHTRRRMGDLEPGFQVFSLKQ